MELIIYLVYDLIILRKMCAKYHSDVSKDEKEIIKYIIK